MNAIKFIQQHGVGKAREVLRGSPALECYFVPKYQQYFVDKHGFVYVLGMFGYFTPSLGMTIENLTKHGFQISDLKHLVESVDYVLIHGHEKSKEILKNAPVGAECYSWSIGNSGVRDKTVELVKLKQAIADYESIYGGEHV